MIKVEHLEVFNFEGAIRGMRNPKNSWSKSDSTFNPLVIGANDLKLMQMLYQGGSVHRKYLRQIFVSADITCNHTWWAEFDTYKVATVRDSCSKMHKIHAKPFCTEDFSHEGLDEVEESYGIFVDVVNELERLRYEFNTTQEKKYWRAMIELLPMGFNLKATVTFNYETVMNILDWREQHKMEEWRILCKIFRKELPYINEIRGDSHEISCSL